MSLPKRWKFLGFQTQASDTSSDSSYKNEMGPDRHRLMNQTSGSESRMSDKQFWFQKVGWNS